MARQKTVYGKMFPSPRLTHTAIWLAVFYLGVPIMMLATLADGVIWLVGWYGFGVCLALWCLL